MMAPGISQHLQGTSTNELVRLCRLDQAFEGVEIAIIGADQDALEGRREAVPQHRFNSLTVLRKTAQEREHARVLPLAREVEEEEDSPRGVTRPIRTAGVAFQHAEQSGGGLIPMVECPLHGLAGQIVTGAPEGLDRGLKVHGKLRPYKGRRVRLWQVDACSPERDAWCGCQCWLCRGTCHGG